MLATTDYEMRCCVNCGHTGVRVRNPEKRMEVACWQCGGVEFDLYTPTWTLVERSS